tara:strand:- start:3844 stop:4236 length:393 start_codon:yes stop_codon:yes gene_type:complete
VAERLRQRLARQRVQTTRRKVLGEEKQISRAHALVPRKMDQRVQTSQKGTVRSSQDDFEKLEEILPLLSTIQTRFPKKSPRGARTQSCRNQTSLFEKTQVAHETGASQKKTQVAEKTMITDYPVTTVSLI